MLPAAVRKSAAPSNLDAAYLTETLQAALASPSYRPPLLPTVAMEVMQLTQAPNAQLGEIAKLLERDPVLAARVLAIVQSAHYAARSPVMSLRLAAVRLGVDGLREVVLRAAVELTVFRAPGFQPIFERFNAHATAAAHLTRELCRRARIDAVHAFTCGLLHDVGFSACLVLAVQHRQWAEAPFDTLAPALDAVHADASGLLARTWKLPAPIPQVMGTHHEVVVDGVPQPMNAALVVADQLCWEAGAGILPPPPDADAFAIDTPDQPLHGIDTNWPSTIEQACEILRLDRDSLSKARHEAFQLVEALGLAGPR